MGELDKLLYELGLIVAGIVIALLLLYMMTGISVFNMGFRCNFYRLTGLPCPGCGATRALRALVNGQWMKCLYYYPPLIYGVIAYIVFMLRCFIYRHLGLIKAKDGAVVKYIYIGIALIVVQWAAKLIAQLVFGYAWLG